MCPPFVRPATLRAACTAWSLCTCSAMFSQQTRTAVRCTTQVWTKVHLTRTFILPVPL